MEKYDFVIYKCIYFCLKISKKIIFIDTTTHKPIANFKSKIFWMWNTRFWKKSYTFFIILKKRKLERYKNTNVQTQRLNKTDLSLNRVGWVVAEKIGLYKLFPTQDVISLTLSVISGPGATVSWGQYLFLTLLRNMEARSRECRTD